MNDSMKQQTRLAVSFVHGYENLRLNISGESLPALWIYDPGSGQRQVFNYPFPRNKEEFQDHGAVLAGEPPLPSAGTFQTLPRFGLTGLAGHDGNIYAGSWNGVYEIDAATFALKRIISNSLMSDLHGVHADEDGLWTVLTCQDTLVLNDFDGNPQRTWSISGDLSVTPYEGSGVDWRFVSKQFRGSCGLFHFNHVQRLDGKIWLTSRSCNAFVVLDPEADRAELRLMNLCTPALLHDGNFIDGKFYFTSIDGKIIIAEDAVAAGKTLRENVDQVELYRRDLAAEIIRLNETAFGREPNWCRGFERTGEVNYVTVDGRYGSDLSFGLVGVTDSGELALEKRLRWVDVGDERELRYVTGFDVLALEGAAS